MVRVQEGIMSKVIAYIRQLVGNGKAATIGIFAFIVILCLLFGRCHAAEVDLAAGSSFGTEGYGPVLDLTYKQPITSNPGLSAIAGTDLWGSTVKGGQTVPNNWDWHAGLETCRWHVCADLGAAYVQRVDAINGAHTNYVLGLTVPLTSRLRLMIVHISDAGTSSPNVGRQALMLAYKLQ
jgi:hypothetical protein